MSLPSPASAEEPAPPAGRPSRARTVTSFIVLSMTGGVIFQVAYIRFVFLQETSTALHLTASQYGTVVSVFGGTATVMYFVGGWFSDRFSPKVLITTALIGTGLADLALATVPGFTGTLLLHVAMAVLGMAFYWSALVKAIGMLGDASSQGRLFGFLEGLRGLTSTVIGFLGAGIVAAAAMPSGGILTVIRLYGVLCFVLAVLVVIVVREDGERLAALGRSAVSVRQLLDAVRLPATWLVGGTIAMMFCFYTTLAYFSPLLGAGFGVGAAALGVINVIRSYVFQFVAGPVGGFAVDKVAHSSTRFLRWMFVACALMAAAFLVLPRDPAFVVVALGLLVVLSFAVFMSRGVYWATVGELGIPAERRGGVIGLASGIAYLPDAFLPALCTWWIGDPDHGVSPRGGGYTALFVFLVAAGVAGIALTTLVDRQKRRRDLTKGTAWRSPTSPSTTSL